MEDENALPSSFARTRTHEDYTESRELLRRMVTRPDLVKDDANRFNEDFEDLLAVCAANWLELHCERGIIYEPF